MNIALKLLLLTFGASIFLSTQSLDENSLSVNKRIKEYLYDMHYIPESDVLDQRSLWAKRDEHNKKVLSKSNLKIVKGGSWFDGLAYQQFGSRQVLPKDTKSMKVGFRIAATIKKGNVKNFLNKENIQTN